MAENIYAAAFVKSLEKNMFTDKDFAYMLTIDAEDMPAVLAEHGYEGKSAADMLENEEARIREICAELCESEELLDVMLAKDTFHNIKTALKCGICGKGGKSLFKTPTRVDTEAIFLAAKTGDFKKVEDEFAIRAYKEYKKSGILGKIDACLDRLMVDYILEKSADSEFVKGWAEMYAEVAGIKEQRLKEDALGEETALFFKELDDTLTEYLKGAHYSFFNEDAVFAYFFGKETELKNLRLILYGNKIIAEERLRKAYV